MFKKRKPDEDVPRGSPLLPGERRSDLGVPPYRPAPPPPAPIGTPAFISAPIVTAPIGTSSGGAATPKEAQMGRAPFPAPPSPNAQPAARPGTAIPPGPPTSAPFGVAKPAISEKRTLVVGRGISVQGTVQDAERLVVEGTVEASMIQAFELHVAPGGMFRGAAQVTDAEVAGTIDGTVTASGNLIVRATGRLLGSAKCRRLQVEDGGQVTGQLEMIPDSAPAAAGIGPADPFRPAPALPEPAQSRQDGVAAG